jgi:hypothetical protein
MLRRQSIGLKMILQNARFDSETINYDPTMAEKKVAETFENMLPIFVACKIIFTNMEI